MLVRDFMTKDVACCTPQTNIQDVARMMRDYDCGAIPVCEDERSRRAVGIITDRDIVMRAIAEGRNPLQMTAGQLMSTPIATVPPEADLMECCRVMEERQVRRVPVVDRSGACIGIVAQADLALHAPEHETAEVVHEVSKPQGAAAAHV